MLHREKIKAIIVQLLDKATAEDLKMFLIFIDGYLRKKGR